MGLDFLCNSTAGDETNTSYNLQQPNHGLKKTVRMRLMPVEHSARYAAMAHNRMQCSALLSYIYDYKTIIKHSRFFARFFQVRKNALLPETGTLSPMTFPTIYPYRAYRPSHSTPPRQRLLPVSPIFVVLRIWGPE